MAEVVGDAELHRAVLESQREIDRLLAQQAALLAEWDSRGSWAADGSRSAACRLSRETGMSLSHARHLTNRARRMSSMPLTGSLWASGSLASCRVDLLVRANGPGVSSTFVRDESVLLEAMSCFESFGDAQRCVRYWIQLADEEASSCRAERLVAQRSAHASRTFEASVDLRALCDPVAGEKILGELQRLEHQLFESDWAQAKARFKRDDIVSTDLARTPAQRRCDALVLMAERSASVAPGSSTARPLISVLVDYQTFGRVCELASGEVIDPGQVVPLLQEADIERIVFDGKSRVIDVGYKRFFRGALRRAIEIRYRHCQDGSGCEVRAKDCDVDHDTAYSRGGITDQLNGRLLCPWHNRRKGAGPP